MLSLLATSWDCKEKLVKSFPRAAENIRIIEEVTVPQFVFQRYYCRSDLLLLLLDIISLCVQIDPLAFVVGLLFYLFSLL